MKEICILLITCVLFSSCEYFTSEEDRTPIVRVNKSFLYQEDIQNLLDENTSSEDSAIIVSNYINRWATQQLLVDKAKINLSEEQQDSYDRLVLEYKNSLYTEGYKNKVVSLQLDTLVGEQEFEEYYNDFKENFKLNSELLKVRYVHLPSNYLDVAVTKQKLNRFSKEDKLELIEDAIQFISHNLNDSIWVKKEALINVLPILKDKEAQLNNPNNFQLQDSLGVYLLTVKEVLKTNDIAPIEYVRPTLKQIILNKRKLELVKKLETDITKDAIKNNDFETY